jgi:hypothetical protein
MESRLSETHQIRGYGAKPARLRFGASTRSATGLGRAGPFEGELVKRIRMLAVLGVLAVALPISLLSGVAQAGSGPQVTIQEEASYTTAGSLIDVGLAVRCQGGSGNVAVNVTQSSPPSPFGGGAAGSGASNVVCDGQTHEVAVTVFGFGFGAGQAWATADLTVGSPTVVAHDQRWINIVVVH